VHEPVTPLTDGALVRSATARAVWVATKEQPSDQNPTSGDENLPPAMTRATGF
jgi:hypothetical protein